MPPEPPLPPAPPTEPPVPPHPPPAPTADVGTFSDEGFSNFLLVFFYVYFVPCYGFGLALTLYGLVFSIRRGSLARMRLCGSKRAAAPDAPKLEGRSGVCPKLTKGLLGNACVLFMYALFPLAYFYIGFFFGLHGVCGGVLHCTISHFQDDAHELYHNRFPWTTLGRPWSAHRDYPHGCTSDQDCLGMDHCDGLDMVGCGRGNCYTGTTTAFCQSVVDPDVRGNPLYDAPWGARLRLDMVAREQSRWCWKGREDRRCGFTTSGDDHDYVAWPSEACEACLRGFGHPWIIGIWIGLFIVHTLFIYNATGAALVRAVASTRKASKVALADKLGAIKRTAPKLTFHVETYKMETRTVPDNDGYGGSHTTQVKVRLTSSNEVFRFDTCDDLTAETPPEWLTLGPVSVKLRFEICFADEPSSKAFQQQFEAFKSKYPKPGAAGVKQRFWIVQTLPGISGCSQHCDVKGAVSNKAAGTIAACGSLGAPWPLQSGSTEAKQVGNLYFWVGFVMSQTLPLCFYVHAFVLSYGSMTVKKQLKAVPVAVAEGAVVPAEVVGVPASESLELEGAEANEPAPMRAPPSLGRIASDGLQAGAAAIGTSLRRIPSLGSSATAATECPPLNVLRDYFKQEIGVDGATLVAVVDAAVSTVGVTVPRKASLKDKARAVWVELGSPPLGDGSETEADI